MCDCEERLIAIDGKVFFRRLRGDSVNRDLRAICRGEKKGDEVKGGSYAIVFALYLVR
jgi:hypothetical protein